MIYAGDNGGCMACDSVGHELAMRGHRKGCRSPYRNEPRRPAEWRAKQHLEEAKRLAEKIKQHEQKAADILAGKEVEEP